MQEIPIQRQKRKQILHCDGKHVSFLNVKSQSNKKNNIITITLKNQHNKKNKQL